MQDQDPLPSPVIELLLVHASLRVRWLWTCQAGEQRGRRQDHYTCWLALDWPFEIHSAGFQVQVPLGHATIIPVNAVTRHLSQDRAAGNLAFGFSIEMHGKAQDPLAMLNLPQAVALDAATWRRRFSAFPASIGANQPWLRLSARPTCDAFLLDHLARGFASGKYQLASRPIPAWLRSAHEGLRLASVSNPRGFATIARGAGVSPGHLTREFTRHFGETPAAFRSRLKLEHAARMLASDPDLQVRQIAADIGFRSQATFIRQFRKRFGRTPGETRKAP